MGTINRITIFCLFTFISVTSFLIGCSSCSKNRIENEKFRIIVFVDYNPNDKLMSNASQNLKTLNQLLKIKDLLVPEGKADEANFHSYSISIYPLYYKTSRGMQIHHCEVEKDKMANADNGIINARNSFNKKVFEDFKNFTEVNSDENKLSDDLIKIMESCEIFTKGNFDSQKNERIIIIYLSEFMEKACDLDNKTEACFNFFDYTGDNYNVVEVESAIASLSKEDYPLYGYIQKLKPNIPDCIKNSEVYLFPIKDSRVKFPPGKTSQSLMNFWEQYFEALGFENVSQINNFTEIRR